MNHDTLNDWKELSELYEQGDELDDAALDAWVAQLQAQNHRLLPQLNRMLQARKQLRTSDFLDTPPRLSGNPLAPMSDWREGQSVGSYRLLRPIGSGGMAQVWLAARDDGAFTREVALKLLHHPTHSQQRDSIEQRFRRERDILASLTHPHIASLLDAGVTPSGQPWLALEYVLGEQITVWCDQERLDLAGRVRLFLQVLVAVQHAHTNLVIHRDLKPANILVTAQAQVQLLDFGIAKMLEQDGVNTTETELTRFAGRPLTPRYASPEQLRGLPLSTASDVYSLGVVLYELLCGESAYELKLESAAQLENAILENEVRAPSKRALNAQAAAARNATVKALRKALANDLDAVVLKALAKNPERRYASVEALRLDLERWLDGEPVLAKAPSSAYQLHKFVQRNRWSVGLGAAAIVSLVAVATTAVFLGLQARDEAARALAARDFLIDLFGQADPDLSHGKDMTAKELLDQGRKTILSSMTGQPLLQADLMRGLGNAQANMSDYRKADASLAEAARLYEQMDLPEKVARTLIEQADAIYRSGDSQRAERILAGAAVQLREQNANAGTMTRYYEVLSLVELDNGDLSKAKLASEKSLSLATQAFGELDKRTIVALRAVARIEGRAGEFTLAIHRLEEALTRAEHTNNLVPQDRVEIQTELAETEYSAGRFDAAANRLEFAAARCEQLLDPNGESCWFLRQREMVVLFLQGRHQKALTLLPSMLTMAANAESPNRKAEALVTACRVLALNNRALEHPELWANLRLLGDSGQEVKQRESLKIQALFAQAEMLLHSEQPAASQDVLEHAEKRWKADSRANQRTGARLHLMQGLAFQALDQHEPALQSLRAGTAEYALLLGENHPLTVLMSANQARSLWATHRADEALALLDRAIPILRPALGADAPTFVHLLALRGELASTPTPNPRTARKVDFFL